MHNFIRILFKFKLFQLLQNYLPELFAIWPWDTTQPTSLFCFFHVLHNILINHHQSLSILDTIINNIITTYQSICVLVLFHSQTPWQLSQRRSSLILTLVLVSHLISFHSIPFSSKFVSLDLIVSGYPRFLHFIVFICIF